MSYMNDPERTPCNKWVRMRTTQGEYEQWGYRPAGVLTAQGHYFVYNLSIANDDNGRWFAARAFDVITNLGPWNTKAEAMVELDRYYRAVEALERD